MIYLFESNLSEHKSIFFALLKISGLGKKSSFFVCNKLGFSLNLKVKDLSKNQINKILKIIDLLNLQLSQNLKNFKLLVFKKLVSIQTYKGRRRNVGLPVRGQRTHTNARTARKKLL